MTATSDTRDGAPPTPEARYVYAIVPASLGTAAARAQGEHTVETVAVEGLAAIVGPVPDEDRGRDLSDPAELAWLERRARAHDTIVSAVAAVGPTVPVRFGVALPDVAAVSALLGRHAARIHGELERIAGAAEWSLRIRRDPDAARSAPVTAADDGGGGGAAYLRRRSVQRTADEQRRSRVEQAVGDAHARLASLAREAAALPPPRLGEGDEARVFHGAYLVDESTRPAFHATTEAVAETLLTVGLRTELAGPLAPHHFVRVDLGAQGESA